MKFVTHIAVIFAITWLQLWPLLFICLVIYMLYIFISIGIRVHGRDRTPPPQTIEVTIDHAAIAKRRGITAPPLATIDVEFVEVPKRAITKSSRWD